MPILCFILGGLLVPRMVLAKGLIQVPPPRPAAAPAPTQEEIEQREQADKKEREDACRTEEKQVTDICADASTAIMNANKQADLSSQRLDEISHLFDQKLNAVLEKMTHSGRSCEGMNDLVKGGEEVKEQSLKKMEEIDGSNKLTERLFGKAYEKTLQCEDQKKVCASTCSEFPNLKVICSPPEKYEEKIGAITEKIATNKSKADVARVKSKEVPAKIQAHVESSRSGKGECSAAERRMQKVEDGFLAEKKRA